MKYILTILLLTVSTFASTSVTAKITKIKSDRGVLRVVLYTSEQAMKNKEIYKAQPVKAQKGSVETSFDVEPGTYMIVVLHDENENKKMDKNGMGIPKEPYGVSNNKFKSFGRPSFTLSAFEIKEGETLTKEVQLLDK